MVFICYILVKNYLYLCVCFYVRVIVYILNKVYLILGASITLLNDQGNIDELIESKEVRRPVRQYSQYDYGE